LRQPSQPAFASFRTNAVIHSDLPQRRFSLASTGWTAPKVGFAHLGATSPAPTQSRRSVVGLHWFLAVCTLCDACRVRGTNVNVRCCTSVI